MTVCRNDLTDRLARASVGRPRSLFENAYTGGGEIRLAFEDSRVLVVGGAGSIGSATVVEILKHEPSVVVVVDTNENDMVELVRTVRSDKSIYGAPLSTVSLDYGSPLCRSWLSTQLPFDWILSFAALKHVRNERNTESILRMCDVNVVATDSFLGACRTNGHGRKGVFFVSTDKAAAPSSFMGASKRAMEAVLWAHAADNSPTTVANSYAGPIPPLKRVTSARFANVAFSNGSLPWGFLNRLAKAQPLSAPTDVRRYLVTMEEAAQFCLVAAVRAPNHHLLIPELDPDTDTVRFEDIARIVVENAGYKCKIYRDPSQARAQIDKDISTGRYPVCLTQTDTSGEKMIEQFVCESESALDDIELPGCLAVPAIGVPLSRLSVLVSELKRLARTEDRPPPSVEALRKLLVSAIPVFEPSITSSSLDDKM